MSFVQHWIGYWPGITICKYLNESWKKIYVYSIFVRCKVCGNHVEPQLWIWLDELRIPGWKMLHTHTHYMNWHRWSLKIISDWMLNERIMLTFFFVHYTHFNILQRQSIFWAFFVFCSLIILIVFFSLFHVCFSVFFRLFYRLEWCVCKFFCCCHFTTSFFFIDAYCLPQFVLTARIEQPNMDDLARSEF